MISDEELLAFSKHGFWPGPEEKEQEFHARIYATQQEAILSIHDDSTRKICEKAGAVTESLFGFVAGCLPFSYEDKGLALWEGAALFVEEKDQTCIPRIQLKKKFQKGRFLGYCAVEVLAHEMLHAARLQYNAPRYEEILAYKTSKSCFRRALGPLFQTPKESYIFVSLLMLGVAVECALEGQLFVFFGMAAPFAWVGYLGVRLYFRLKTVKRAHSTLSLYFSNPSKAAAILARLTDSEVDLAANNNIKEILENKKGQDLRSRLLRLWFFT